MMEYVSASAPQPDRGAEDFAQDGFDSDVQHGFEDRSDTEGSGEAGLGFGAGVEEGAAAGGRKKPSRGRRGGARARKKRTAASSDGAQDAPASSADADGSDPGDEKPPARKAKARRGSRKKATARAASEGDSGGDSAPAESAGASDDGEGGEATATKRKRSRSRRGKKGGKASSRDEGGSESDSPEAQGRGDDEGDGEEGPKKRRRRGSRGGRRRKKSAASEAVVVEAIPGEEDDLPPSVSDASESSEAGGKKRRKSRSKKKSSKSDDDEPKRKAKASKKAKAGSGSKKASKTKKKEDVVPDQVILVNAIDREEQRVAVVKDTKIVDFLMTVESQKTLVNDIYRGRIVNMEPAIGAAFVDFGQGRNGFLHTSDVLSAYGEKGFELSKLWTTPIEVDEWEESSVADEVDDEEDQEEKGERNGKEGKGSAKDKKGQASRRRRGRKREPISDLLSVGDQVVVQITKDAIGDKGPTLTTYVSMPGRYLVLMPSMARTGVSRKIPDDRERRRLKRILSSMDLPANMGVIVRTAGVGKTKAELQRDLDYLMGLWETFGKRLKSGRGPMPLYQESEVAIRTMRDLFNTHTEAVVVDDPIVHDQLVDFAQKLMPEQVDRIKLHDGDRPVFHHYGIEQDFEKIFARRVELPSGGSIVFDQTEALVAIDVNSGRTRSDGFDFEDVALKTNLEAAPEIARQIRLRDLGGILVCDFIDMMKGSSNRTVERALRSAMADDRARSKLGRISQFGLLELTRQRLGPGMHKKVFQVCPRCRGTGRVRSVPSRAAAILRRLGSAVTQKGFATIEVRAHPEVVDYLDDELMDYLRALEHRSDRKINLTAVPDQPEDSVLRYLRADGREVRPGGRRKR